MPRSPFNGAPSSLSCPLFINVQKTNYVVLSDENVSRYY